MARPIEPTPTLNAEEAEGLYELMGRAKPISQVERERMKRNYEFIRSIATFDLPSILLPNFLAISHKLSPSFTKYITILYIS